MNFHSSIKGVASKPERVPLWRRPAWQGFFAVLAVRALVFPFAKNFYGDPAMRLKALSAFMAHPIFLRSFVVAHQFGPLHLYLLALGQWIHRDLEAGPRLLSLIFGSLTAFPLFSLAERRFGPTAALLSTLGLAIYPLHIQTSTTATSEAVFLFFLLSALALLDRAAAPPGEAPAGGRFTLQAAGLLMACACAVRYDGWLYAPLSWAWLWPPLRERRLPIGRALGYAALTSLVPLVLLFGNWRDLGDPLYVMHYIDADHLANAHRLAAQMGRLPYALYCLAFWPANLAWELTPPMALGVSVGAAAALRLGRARDLLCLAALPAALFTLEGALLLRFHPLARFTLPTAVLLLPYAGDGLLRAFRALAPSRRPLAVGVAIAAALAVPGFLAWRTLGRGDWVADTLRPVSPISNLPPDLSAASDWLCANAGTRKVEVETNWLFEELPIQFYGQLGGAEVFSPRDGQPRQGFEPPDLLVLPRDSDLLRSNRARLQGDLLWRDGQRFTAVAHLGAVTVFQRQD